MRVSWLPGYWPDRTIETLKKEKNWDEEDVGNKKEPANQCSRGLHQENITDLSWCIFEMKFFFKSIESRDCRFLDRNKTKKKRIRNWIYNPRRWRRNKSNGRWSRATHEGPGVWLRFAPKAKNPNGSRDLHKTSVRPLSKDAIRFHRG